MTGSRSCRRPLPAYPSPSRHDTPTVLCRAQQQMSTRRGKTFTVCRTSVRQRRCGAAAELWGSHTQSVAYLDRGHADCQVRGDCEVQEPFCPAAQPRVHKDVARHISAEPRRTKHAYQAVHQHGHACGKGRIPYDCIQDMPAWLNRLMPIKTAVQAATGGSLETQTPSVQRRSSNWRAATALTSAHAVNRKRYVAPAMTAHQA